MTLVVVAESAPLTVSGDGVVLVGGTRVTLDTIVTIFKQGMTAEEIAYRYPSLRLAAVYGAIAYYLGHQDEVEAYLALRRSVGREVRVVNERRFDQQGLRDRLLARQVGRSA
jgi:uncharacterized protein (DUF433 family)